MVSRRDAGEVQAVAATAAGGSETTTLTAPGGKGSRRRRFSAPLRLGGRSSSPRAGCSWSMRTWRRLLKIAVKLVKLFGHPEIRRSLAYHFLTGAGRRGVCCCQVLREDEDRFSCESTPLLARRTRLT